jgi:hypothetical protein
VINTQADLTEFANARFVHDRTGKRTGAVWRRADGLYVAWKRARKLGEFIDADEAVKAVLEPESK